MVSYVMGDNPPFPVMEGYFRRIWKHLAIDKILMMKKEIFLVRFQDDNSVEQVLQQEYAQFDEKSVVIVPWSSDLKYDKGEVEKVHLWIQFPELLVKYWNMRVLSKLASQVGVPKEMDMLTAQRNRGGYAQILIQTGLQSELKTTVKYLAEDGRMMDQVVKYEWLPIHCSVCKEHDHPTDHCRRRVVKKVWVAKPPIPQVPEAVQEPVKNDPAPPAQEGGEWITVGSCKKRSSVTTQATEGRDSWARRGGF